MVDNNVTSLVVHHDKVLMQCRSIQSYLKGNNCERS